MARRSDNGRDGVLIDTWHWRYVGVESSLSAHLRGEEEEPDGPNDKCRSDDKRDVLVQDKVIAIEVRLLKKYKEEALPRTVDGVEFAVVCKELDIRLVGTDIETLRVALWGKLEKEHEIQWEEYMLVQIASAQSFVGDRETGFALSENTIYKGTARDGSVLMREYDRGRSFGPWRYKPWPKEYENRAGHVIACIPASKKNIKAMEEFRARIRELQARLSELVRPEVIVQTLADLSGTGLLPAPSEKQLDEA